MNSLRSYLAIMLIAAFALVSFLAALNGYLSSMREAEEMLDQQLTYASEILAESYRNGSDSESQEQGDSGMVFQVWRAGELVQASAGAPHQPISAQAEGYHFTNFLGYRWRTHTHADRNGMVYMVAERADLRHRVAENVVLGSVTPWLLWLPLSAILVWVVVGWGLRPLQQLSREINQKRSDNLAPITHENPPLELVQLIESTNSLLARLSASFEREKHFASHAAHELRTPLSVLKVHLHNLASELPRDHEGLGHANAGVERMHHLVEQILDLNRTNPELIRGNFEPLDLHKLARHVTAEYWPAFSDKNQTISMQGDRAVMQGDSVMLETLLGNLLANANKYTPEGGEIEVNVSSVDDGVALVVADSGPGVPAAERGHVFERFYRARDSIFQEATGSGLGLAIVKHICQLHDARISLNDSKLGGLQVTVVFPNRRIA